MENFVVVVVENGAIVIYKSTDRQALYEVVARAKVRHNPYAVLSPKEFTTV